MSAASGMAASCSSSRADGADAVRSMIRAALRLSGWSLEVSTLTSSFSTTRTFLYLTGHPNPVPLLIQRQQKGKAGANSCDHD